MACRATRIRCGVSQAGVIAAAGRHWLRNRLSFVVVEFRPYCGTRVCPIILVAFPFHCASLAV